MSDDDRNTFCEKLELKEEFKPCSKSGACFLHDGHRDACQRLIPQCTCRFNRSDHGWKSETRCDLHGQRGGR